MSQRDLAVGIIGLGYGRAHISGFEAAGCRVVAVCQRDEAAAKALAARYGVPRVFTRWEDLLAEAHPDVVVIATPPHLHHAMAVRAFAAGAHVVCEKPLAMSVAEARAMLDAAARAGRVAMTGFNWRFPAAMRRFHDLVRDGAIGRPFHVLARWYGSRWADEAIAPTWRMDRSQAGHGSLGDMGVHLVDLVRWNFGEFRRVVAHTGVGYPSRTVPGGARRADAEDFAAVVAELASGVQATLVTSRVTRGVNEHTVEAYGTAGALAYRFERDSPHWWTGQLHAASASGGLAPVTIAPEAVSGDQVEIVGRATIAPLVRELVAAIEQGTPAVPSFEDGMRAQAVLDAIGESITRGGWVDVPV